MDWKALLERGFFFYFFDIPSFCVMFNQESKKACVRMVTDVTFNLKCLSQDLEFQHPQLYPERSFLFSTGWWVARPQYSSSISFWWESERCSPCFYPGATGGEPETVDRMCRPAAVPDPRRGSHPSIWWQSSSLLLPCWLRAGLRPSIRPWRAGLS